MRQEPWHERYVPEPNTGCWLWLGGVNGTGYGCAYDATGHQVRAHRLFYEKFKGPIPAGLELDHRCRQRSCVNPAHLDAVTRSENLHRSPIVTWQKKKQLTHCKHGHAFDEANTCYRLAGGRGCRRCSYEAKKRFDARKTLGGN